MPVDFYPFDAEYVRRLRAGEPEVQEHFSLYFQELLRMKLWSGRYSPTDIEDIVQETFLRALVKLRDGKLRQPDRLGPFVFGICKRICQERLREKKLESLPDDYSPSSKDNQERELIEAERARAVRNTISEMPAKERRLLVASFFKERSNADVGEELGLTPGYLRVCLHRAKKTLKRRFLRKFDEKHKPDGKPKPNEKQEPEKEKPDEKHKPNDNEKDH